MTMDLFLSDVELRQLGPGSIGLKPGASGLSLVICLVGMNRRAA